MQPQKNTSKLKRYLMRSICNTIKMECEGFTRTKRLEEFDCRDKLKLIKTVEKRILIWDMRHKKHFDATALQSAWASVAAEMNKDVFSCKNAWKSLRDSYRYHMKLAKKAQGQAKSEDADWDPLADSKSKKDKESVKWRFAPHMEFLHQSTLNRSLAPVSTVFVGKLVKPKACPSSPGRPMQPTMPALQARPSPKAKPTPQARPVPEDRPVAQSRPISAYWESELNKLSPEDAETVEQKMTRLLWAETQALRLNSYLKEEEEDLYSLE
ncbi:uncharacterized protein LOC111072989 isoform X2 [Drosophila obscura]|uniref:uncharacterized protein LOC111072989 isoform X2 n=1 Tax=Drosophila obscura TaxID=7282 RepID=UPI000B9FD05B|nr:uncharacterized protein LOC111072989 isoform X2 [Drosophila obscura]